MKYEVAGETKRFYHRHCSRCRKATGTGHASNLFLQPAAHVEQLSTIADTVVAAGGATPGEPRLPKFKVYLIAMVANGLGLLRLARSVRKGAQLDALRGGPLDKRGVGSRVLDFAP